MLFTVPDAMWMGEGTIRMTPTVPFSGPKLQLSLSSLSLGVAREGGGLRISQPAPQSLPASGHLGHTVSSAAQRCLGREVVV